MDRREPAGRREQIVHSLPVESVDREGMSGLEIGEEEVILQRGGIFVAIVDHRAAGDHLIGIARY